MVVLPYKDRLALFTKYLQQLVMESYDALSAASERIESEHTKRVPEHLKNIHLPVNPES